MKRRDSILLAGASLFAGALVQATPAMAQNVTAAQSEESAESDIVVTGSRITKSGFNAPTPTTMLDAEDIANTGATNVGQLMNQIPGFLASMTPSSSTLQSSTPGSAFLNLRGLGNNRTLVLVNGRRFVPTTSAGLVDSNVIPSSLLERVDVVTGGASAAYGSDAVAGVVNLVLKKEIKGFLGDIQSGISSRGDNATLKGSLAYGAGFADGAGHFMLAAEGEKNKGIVSQKNRSWSRRSYGLISNPTYTSTNGQFRQFILPDYQLANATLGGLITSGSLRGTDFTPGTPTPFTYGQYQGAFQVGGSGVNANLYTGLVVPTERASFFSMADYDFGGVRAFVEGSYSYARGYNKELIPAFHLGNITIQRDNAFLDPALRARLLPTETSFSFGRYSPDFGFIQTDTRTSTYRLVGGLEGEIGGNWKWTVYGEYGRSNFSSIQPNNVISARFAKSVDAVMGTNGQAVCRVNADSSTSNDDPACVPVNLFGVGSPSQSAIDYFTGTTVLRSVFNERVLSGDIQGDLFSITSDPISMAVGAEYREDRVAVTSDPISQASGFLIANPKPIAGKFNVKEAFVELAVPLLRDLHFAQALDLSAALRVTDYSTSGTVTTWKVGGTYEPLTGLRFRATRSRDIRAPTLDELFTSSSLRFDVVTDPFVPPPNQLNVQRITTGNPNLSPEVANTLTAGIVLEPAFLPGLRLSADYYRIKIADAISVLAPQAIIDGCFKGNTTLCGFLTRNGSGTLTQVNVAQVNVSKLINRGVDIEGSYQLPLSRLGLQSKGSLSFRGLATYVAELSSDGVDRAGDVGAALPVVNSSPRNGVPHWRYNLSVTYANGPFTLFVEERFVGGGKYDNTYGPLDLANNHIAGQHYVNLSASFSIIDDGERKLQFFGNVNNLFDNDPPPNPASFFAPQQTNTLLYDVVGRMFQVGARFKY